MPHTVNYSGKRGLSNAKINQKKETIMIVSGKDLYLSLFPPRFTHFQRIFQKQPKLLPLGTSPAYETVMLLHLLLF